MKRGLGIGGCAHRNQSTGRHQSKGKVLAGEGWGVPFREGWGTSAAAFISHNTHTQAQTAGAAGAAHGSATFAARRRRGCGRRCGLLRAQSRVRLRVRFTRSGACRRAGGRCGAVRSEPGAHLLLGLGHRVLHPLEVGIQRVSLGLHLLAGGGRGRGALKQRGGRSGGGGRSGPGPAALLLGWGRTGRACARAQWAPRAAPTRAPPPTHTPGAWRRRAGAPPPAAAAGSRPWRPC